MSPQKMTYVTKIDLCIQKLTCEAKMLKTHARKITKYFFQWKHLLMNFEDYGPHRVVL